MPVFKSVNKDFFKKWTSDMAYVLGFFAADGYITINRRGAHFWCIQIADRKLLHKIKTVVESQHKISKKVHGKNGGVTYRLQIGSIEMCKDLMSLGFRPNKTSNMAIPGVPNEFFRDFVRGYFDGDGNVWVGNVHKDRRKPLLVIRTVFTSCARGFLKDLGSRLYTHGIPHGTFYADKGNYGRLMYSVHSSLKLFDFMYNHVVPKDVFLKRKKIVFEKYVKMRS